MCFEDVADSVDDLGSLVRGDGSPTRASVACKVDRRVDVTDRRSNAGLREVSPLPRRGRG